MVSPSIDGIQEFKIQKTMYPAEFGAKSSALISEATAVTTEARIDRVLDRGGRRFKSSRPDENSRKACRNAGFFVGQSQAFSLVEHSVSSE